MRFVGERRAVAAGALAYFMVLLLQLGWQYNGPEKAMLFALGLAYLVGFLGVAAGWFWARWYSLGLGFSGVALAVLLGWQQGLITEVWVIGLFHGVACLALLGDEAASIFDGRRDWRERWKMDENAVNRLGKAVMRAGASLPYLIVAGLGPKQGMALDLAALLLGVVGLSAVVRMRTWGVLVLGGAAAAAWASTTQPMMGAELAFMPVGVLRWLGAGLLTAAVVPFAAPIARSLRHD